MSSDGVLTLLQSYDQREFPKQHRKDWAAEERIAPPTTIERDIKIMFLDKGLSSRGLGLAYETLDDCQDQASIKLATEASDSSSGIPFDAAIQQFRKPNAVDRHSSTCRAGVVAESVSGSSEEALERMTVPTCTRHRTQAPEPCTNRLRMPWRTSGPTQSHATTSLPSAQNERKFSTQ
jgi:hypothetical protein